MCEPVFACDRTNRSYFGCAISIDKNRPKPFDHLLLHIDGASRTGVRHDFDARHVVLFAYVERKVEQTLEVRWYHDAAGNFVGLNSLQHALWVELFHDDNRGTRCKHTHTRQRTRVIHRAHNDVRTQQGKTVLL